MNRLQMRAILYMLCNSVASVDSDLNRYLNISDG